MAAVLLAFLYAVPLWAQEAQEAVVRGIMGNVKVFSARDRRADPNNVSTWPDARLNMTLRSRDMIATLAESEVRLETPDGSTVRLREKTLLEIASIKGGAETKLRLVDGSIVTNVKKMIGGNNRTFEVYTPTSLAAIRGTTLEVDSRRNHGTTVKTFDGKVEVAPAGGKRFAAVGNYQMTEIAPGQRSARVRGVPSFYRPRTTKLLSEEETSALTGFTRVILTYSELEEIQARFEADGIASAIGIGESDDEMVARNVSADAARSVLAASMSTMVQRISESYTQNIGGEAKSIWEEGVRQITDVKVRGSTVHTTITQYNRDNNRFKVYSLMVIDPNRVKLSLSHTVGRLEEEYELRAKKDDMMARMDASIKAFNTRYHDR
jgi:hypothetical protein